jgi:DNA-binding NarL/FixJ family response regulator/ribosomal protein L37AE/L43A
VSAPGAADPEPPRVVIADDQTQVRRGFRLILGSADIPVVAEAANGNEAVAAVRKHRPDVVLMDIRMPELDGLEATRRILAGASSGEDVRIIILTTFDLDQYVYAALAAGASGFLLKDVSPEHLVAAVQLVRTGDALLAPSITRRLVERFAPRPAPAGAAGGDLSALTPRELEVLGLVARGMSSAELAVSGLARTRLAKSVHDAGWSRFVAMLQYKARLHGRTFIKIGRFEPTSRTCSACGTTDGPKRLHIRVWQCRACGTWLDRDINAPVNVARAAGLAVSACGAQVRPGVIQAQRSETGTLPGAA